MRAAEPKPHEPANVTRRKTVCPFCAVGCSIWAEVKNGAWIGQEPVFESPINLGTHCAKGAATRELAIGHRRLKYPLKRENGAWKKISWDQAIDEIGDKLLDIRKKSGPDSVYWLGSAKHSNEMAYLLRKFAAFWGSNNVDHQARICHSTTVAGVANSYGYGAMTNTFNDIHNSKSIFLLGGNPAEAHPVSMQHLLRAKENGCKLIVVDPRYTRTAAHADEFVRLRPGTDVAFIWGVLHVVLKNGWEDKEYIKQRVFGFDDVRKEVEKYPPDVVANITGVPEEQIKRVAEITAKNRPGTLIWCMGLTQSTIGNNKTRAASIYQLALGNIGKSGGGANIFRGHDNVQGATDMGVLCDNLPGYYGLSEGAWRHWSRVWDVDYEWMQKRFASKKLMELKGIPVSRWFDGVLEDKKDIDQPNDIRAMIFWGHAPNSQTRGPDLKKGLEKVDLLVVIDPVPTLSAVIADRKDGTYLLPAGIDHGMRRLGDQFEPLAAMAREGHRADVRFQIRLHYRLSAGEEARLCRRTVQAHRGQGQRAGCRRYPARAQPRQLDHRLYRPVAGAAQAAHAAPGPVRHHHADRQGRSGKGRILRPALAVLGHAGDEASRHAAALRPVEDHRRGRAAVPRPLGRGAQGRQPAGGQVLSQGLADQGRLSGNDHGRARQARLRRSAQAAGKGHHRRHRRRQFPSGVA